MQSQGDADFQSSSGLIDWNPKASIQTQKMTPQKRDTNKDLKFKERPNSDSELDIVPIPNSGDYGQIENEIKDSKMDDWVVPVQEDKTTRQELVNFKLMFDSLDIQKEKLLHVVFYQFTGFFKLNIFFNEQEQHNEESNVTIQKVILWILGIYMLPK